MAKRARKQTPRGSFNDMVIELQDYRRKKLQILPRNLHQEDFLDSLNDRSKHIVFATVNGSANDDASGVLEYYNNGYWWNHIYIFSI